MAQIFKEFRVGIPPIYFYTSVSLSPSIVLYILLLAGV